MDAWSGGSAAGSVARGRNFVLAHGSCFELVKALPDASVDLICIDPPYTQGSAAPVDPKVCSYQNVAWSEAEWRAILREGTRVLRKGGKQLIFCSNKMRRELEALVDSEPLRKLCKMDCPYVWERAGNLLTTADRVSYAYREPALEFVLVIQQHHQLAASSLALAAQGASRFLGTFGRPQGASVKHPELYRKLLGRYEPGVVLDYCMNTGVCGTVALEVGHQFLGVEVVPAIYSKALANFERETIYEAPVPPPSKLSYPPKASAPKSRKRKAEALCTVCTVNLVDTRPCLGGGSRCRRCGMYWRNHGGREEWHKGVKPRGVHPKCA